VKIPKIQSTPLQLTADFAPNLADQIAKPSAHSAQLRFFGPNVALFLKDFGFRGPNPPRRLI
jgi:hypothetical protein